MPTPRSGESRDDFIDRCMGDAEANEDFPDADQRLAFCQSTYDQAQNVSEHLLVTAQQTGAIRTVTHQGRKHRVIPAVLVREQVLSNNLGDTFLPADEIERSVPAWNDMPVVIRHPQKRGQPISARSPDILDRRGVGRVFNARFEDGALKADIFVDMERAGAVKDADQVVKNVDHGKPVELSTGFGTNLEERQGSHDGRRFEAVLTNIQPDHLALLIEEKGACSVHDGCGLGVNSDDDDCGCGKGENMADGTEQDDGVQNADEVAESLWSRLKSFITNEERDMEREEMIAALQEAGCPLSEERLSELDGEELEALNQSYASDPDAGASGDGTTQKDTEAVNELLAEVRDELATLKEATQPAVEERENRRQNLVDALAENTRCAFEQDELEEMTMAQLEKLAKTARVRNYAGRGGPKADDRSGDEPFAEVRPYWQSENGEEG